MKIILSLMYPFAIYFSLQYFNTNLEEVFFLKSFPLLISSIVTVMMLLSFIQKKSLILYFAKKFSKHTIDKDEEVYIHKSTLFWILVSVTNNIVHFMVFINIGNEIFWVFYSSIGWYLLFICAGIIQYLHRKFIFLKRKSIEA